MHDHHRQRVRERLLKGGPESFSPHEILEFILFYAIPRGDTNAIAHELLRTFGSYRGIFEASLEELTAVKGIGESSAMLLKLIPELTRRYAEEQSKPMARFNTVSSIAEFFIRRFIGVNREQLHMMLLNNRMGLIDCITVSEGSVNCSAVPVRLMTETALMKKASAVVLAHNHPNGLAIPSGSDLDVTDQLSNAFHLLGIPLVEHLVIADGRFMPIMKHHGAQMRRLELELSIESVTTERFYDVDEAQWQFPPIFPPRVNTVREE